MELRTESAPDEELQQDLARLDEEDAAEPYEELERKTLADRTAREAEAAARREADARLHREEDALLEAAMAKKADLVRKRRVIERRLLRRQGKLNELKPVFLREMQAEEVVDFVDACEDWLVTHHKKRYEDASSVFGGSARRLVEDIVLALSRNSVDRFGGVQTMFKLFVNGDPQRGKSNVEAVMARIVHFISNSPLVKDKCYSLLGSVMIGWAESLFANTRDLLADLDEFKKEAREKEGRRTVRTADGESIDDESDSDDELAEDNVEEAAGGEGAAGGVPALMRAELVLGKKGTPEEDLRHLDAALNGGVLVFPRNMNALARVNKLVHRVWRKAQEQPAEDRIVPVHFVFLDEADQMRGSTAQSSAETNRASLYQYEQQLMHLFGIKRCLDGNEPLLVPALVVDISATNQLCFLDLILRLKDPTRKLLDVLSFTEDKDGYAGLDKCVAYKENGEDIVLEPKQLALSTGHIDDTVIGWYKDVISKPNACGLAVASNRVTADHSMDDHFKEASSRALAALRKESSPGKPCKSSHIGVIVHGGESQYEGCMGIYMCGSTRERHLSVVDRQLEACIPPLPPVAPKTKHHKTGEPWIYGDLCAKDLRPLMEKLDLECLAASQAAAEAAKKADNPGGSAPYKLRLAQTKEEKERKEKPRKLSCVHLSLLLTLLRRLFPGTPIFIVGHGMVRRCLSLVGVDYELGKLKTTLVVTHMFIWATPAANGSGVVQQAGRCCTTLVDFRNREGNAMFKEVQLLAPELVWDYIRGGLAFNCWFGRSEPGMSAAEARDKIVQTIRGAQVCWEANGGNSAGFARAVVAHLEMPEDVQVFLRSRGAVPPSAALHIKLLRDHFATVGLRNANASFGVIEVRTYLDPEAREAEVRLLFRTVAFTGGAAKQTEWLLGELPFASLEERDLAKHSGALEIARVVNTHLDSVEPDKPWAEVQERCMDAFEDAKSEAQPAGGGKFTQDATKDLARRLERRLLPAADDASAQMSD